MGAALNFLVGVLFVIIKMFICLASQADVNQIVHTSLTKKEMLLKSQIAKEKIKIKNLEKRLKERQKEAQTFDYGYLKTRESVQLFLIGVPTLNYLSEYQKI